MSILLAYQHKKALVTKKEWNNVESSALGWLKYTSDIAKVVGLSVKKLISTFSSNTGECQFLLAYQHKKALVTKKEWNNVESSTLGWLKYTSDVAKVVGLSVKN